MHMLDIAILFLAMPLAFFAILPAVWAWRFIIYFYRHTRIVPPACDPCPNVTVILCLRGADPSLDACLSGLLHQDFPRYQIQIVVDNPYDLAMPRVNEILARGYPGTVTVNVQTLEKHCPTCSLKVCSQLQAVRHLGPEVDVVVLIDADAIPARDWLRALVEPMRDPRVGATSGMRWFAPVDRSWGSLLRHIFNIGSYPQMFIYDHPWGGSMAIRADVVRESSLKLRWCQALCEDSATTGPVHEMGLKMVFVPAATQINAEHISWLASLRFVQRQLLCVRLDHVDWPHLLSMNMLHVFAIVALVGLAGVGVMIERWDWTLIGGGILGVLNAGLFAGINTAEHVIRRNFRIRGIEPPPIVWTWKMLPMLFLTQFICMYYLMRAHVLRQVAWRGINYIIQGQQEIRLEEYKPYQPPDTSTSSQHSTV